MKMLRVLISIVGAMPFLITSALADGDVLKGETVFKKCMACHEAAKPVNKTGPHMIGIVGRKVASVEGYKYSEAMTAYGTRLPVWDEASLNAYLEKPKAIVAGTKMAFGGLTKPDDRDNLIAYLRTLK